MVKRGPREQKRAKESKREQKRAKESKREQKRAKSHSYRKQTKKDKPDAWGETYNGVDELLPIGIVSWY
jgi:hypothetical protein